MEELSLSREQSETRLRQDIESAWEPYFDRTTINRTQFARRMRYAIEPVLIAEYKSAALALLQRFLKAEDIDLEELDELADTDMQKWSSELGSMLAETTGKWIEDDENPGRAFSRERAELIAITEITRARTQGEMAAAAILEELDILLDARWFTMEDERTCPVCAPLHKTPEKFWREILPNGTPAHPRCRCRLDWKEKKRRPKLIGRIRRPARGEPDEQPETPGRSSVQRFSRVRRPARMQTRKREAVQDFEVLMGTLRLFESVAVEGPTVGGLAIVAKDTGRVLMLQRSMSDQDDPASGKWEFPGGHIEDAEEPFQAACREWSEEVGQKCPVSEFAGHWDSGIYRGHVAVVDSESVIPIMDDRKVLNPDDPDQDWVEVVAWWNPYDMKNNPAIREELNDAIDDVLETIAQCCETNGSIRESELDPRDGDGDGLIDDGKSSERPANKKEKVTPSQSDDSFDYGTPWVQTIGSAERQSQLESSGRKYLFHGTSSKALSSIKKNGLLGGQGDGATASGTYNPDNAKVQVTTSLADATMYAQHASKATGSMPVVIAVEVTPEIKKSGKRNPLNRTTYLFDRIDPANLQAVGDSELSRVQMVESELDPRDGDGDGLIDDGKQSERAATKQPATKDGPSPGKPVSYKAFRGVSDRPPNDHGVAGKGSYWSGSRQVAEAYASGPGGKVLEDTISLERPLSVTYRELTDIQQKLYGKMLTGFEEDLSAKFDSWLRDNGYDGVVLFDTEISKDVPQEIVKLYESEADPRDGDGDGVIDDGKSSERPANKKPPKRKTVGLQTKSLEDEIANDSVEHLIVLGADGKAYRTTGGLDNVQMTDEQRQHVKGGTILHNHPEQSSFSPEDLFSFNNSGAKSMVLVDPVARYELAMPNGAMAGATWNLSVRKDIASLVKSEQKRKTPSGDLWHNVNAKLAKKYGWEYSRTMRGG